jgi:hypothetical protein
MRCNRKRNLANIQTNDGTRTEKIKNFAARRAFCAGFWIVSVFS